jgi:hypothetical protein
MSDSDSPINLTAFGGVFSQPGHVRALIMDFFSYIQVVEVSAQMPISYASNG